MNATAISLVLTIVMDAAIGIMVFLTNTRRTVNQLFLALATVMSLWAGCVLRIVQAPSAAEAELWMRIAFIVCTLIPGSFTGLLRAIQSPEISLRSVYRKTWPFWISALAISILCMTGQFLQGALLPAPGTGGVPEAVYGPGFHLYAAFFVIASLAALTRFILDLLRAEAMKRVELQFVLLGSTVCIIIGTTASLFIPLFSKTTGSSQFGPLSSTALMLIIAYGIAKYRIMDVTHILRRATAYALLTTYLVILYGAVWFPTQLLLSGSSEFLAPLSHLFAALAVAFSMAPAHGHLQRFANRLFINVQPLDVGGTLQKANRILDSIRTLDELLRSFAESMAEAVGTDRVIILLLEKEAYEQKYPSPAEGPPTRIPVNDPLIELLKKSREPLVTETIHRLRPTTALTRTGQRLAELRAAIAVGIHSKDGMAGLMLLAPRLSGRVYGAVEQDTLQILCNQLAVALENAKLYTQVQDGKIYNDILLDNLVSGIVAANAEGLITVFNREAQRVTRRLAMDVINHPLNVLPAPLARALELTFQRNYGLRDQEMVLHHGPGDDVPVRVGSSLFHGHAGRVIGALLVFNDVTTIKKLELQVRRTDRLASLGTLAAGMAHEIKNPLVTIKTFTQLLPERYEDLDFRETFSSLIGQEVKRIDTIVNQLLKFSRPAKPDLSPTRLHEVLDNSLKLISQQLRQKGITLVRSYAALNDLVHADPDQLNQAFINFFLNAIEAMDGHGSLHVGTEHVGSDLYSPSQWRERSGEGHIRVSIRDTGEGIDSLNLGRIFDPFFTTKSLGTGLGLSVAHGIIQEHGGMIDVESAPGKGTTFYLLFPLLNKEAAV